MTSAYILIAAMLLLGGLIAALGDRLGSKVGKARLQLFNLRPRQTAQVVTIATGTLIVASTLGILFALSESLRKGVFDLDRILKEQRQVKEELDRVRNERDRVGKELLAAKNEQEAVTKRLRSTNKNFQQAKTQLRTVSEQANVLRGDIQKLLNERQQLFQQRKQLDTEVRRLQTQIQGKDTELKKQESRIADQNKILEQRQIRLQELEKKQSALQAKLNEQDNAIANLDRAISQKDTNLKQREEQLKELESQQAFLKREVEVLEQYYQTYQELREKQIALLRGQVLAFAAVRVVDPNAAIGAIDRLLQQANQNAIGATQPQNPNLQERVVRITQSQVKQLLEQIKDGQDYVVRIISAGNYVQGEKEVRIFADVALNQKIFDKGATLATISLDSSEIAEEDLQKRIDLLLSASQFRARRSGIIGNIQVEDGRIKTILDFIEKVESSQIMPDEIKAIASETTYTSGPLKLRLVAIENGNILFGT
ncbi:DUF3084 domain-containing protein [Candidatus Gracilibacteria bacterium]|nr:DUF3084 domain-containing protein [Candidatus Gracilibacteria bacterium]NJM87230.1 DUF3084 domain-containing protein [Hydrococcus sp. RU_2_2]NJP18655.1 DUF3084 domain-containing protein [Hydrococcus sp. CRU_1_1]